MCVSFLLGYEEILLITTSFSTSGANQVRNNLHQRLQKKKKKILPLARNTCLQYKKK